MWSRALFSQTVECGFAFSTLIQLDFIEWQAQTKWQNDENELYEIFRKLHLNKYKLKCFYTSLVALLCIAWRSLGDTLK